MKVKIISLQALAMLSALEQRLLAASPVALSVAALGKQRSEVYDFIIYLTDKKISQLTHF